MDILLISFLFFSSVIFSVIGFPRDGESSYKNTFFLCCGGVLFLILGISFIMEPVQILSGLTTTINQTTVNVTITNTTATYSNLPRPFTGPLFLISMLTGFFLIFFGVFSIKRD